MLLQHENGLMPSELLALLVQAYPEHRELKAATLNAWLQDLVFNNRVHARLKFMKSENIYFAGPPKVDRSLVITRGLIDA